MDIPPSILNTFSKNKKQMNNEFFNHAALAFDSLTIVNQSTYCPDHFSMAVNTLERYYKGVLISASENSDYSMSRDMMDKISTTHDMLVVLTEIKSNFKDIFPKVSAQEWREQKEFLRTLRRAYTTSRYTSYPTYSEFCVVREFVKTQKEQIEEFFQTKGFEKDTLDIELDL